jgi:hypothetical protein
MKKEYHNAIFDERFELLPEHQQKMIRMFFGSGCYSVAEAVVLWMNSMDCSSGARDMILNYKQEYAKLMDEYTKQTIEQVVRAKIEVKHKEMELLKETDYSAWLNFKNDC